MQKFFIPILLLLVLSASCSDQKSANLPAFEVFCEMVASDAKPIAFHYPLDAAEVDRYWEDFKQIADQMEVEIYREDSLPETMLFPSDGVKGKTVILIYKGPRLNQYQQWKSDLLAANTNDSGVSEALARRLGRLLGYSPQGINELLMKNTDYRTFASFEVTHQITHLYYEEPEKALAFYEQTLGLPRSGKMRFQIGADAFIQIHPFDEDHDRDQPKSTAIALLTDQLPEWYAYMQSGEVPIKYSYKPREGGPHDGFVAIDPGGYLLEFEQFKQHPENELFIAILDKAPRIPTDIQDLQFYGSITWTYHKDLLRMQNFYEEVLGYPLVADQGWTKIFQTSPTGFIGLVDERRGMQDYADQKAVEIEWGLLEEAGFVAYAGAFWKDIGYEDLGLTGPEGYRYIFSSSEK